MPPILCALRLDIQKQDRPAKDVQIEVTGRIPTISAAEF